MTNRDLCVIYHDIEAILILNTKEHEAEAQKNSKGVWPGVLTIRGVCLMLKTRN